MRFLTSGRPRPGLGQDAQEPAGLGKLEALSAAGRRGRSRSGFRCRQLWLLLQSYVHPMKNYIPNGEVVLHYAGGRQTVESLVPPYNLDCYFQHFSRKGLPVALGRARPVAGRLDARFTRACRSAHADAPGDPLRSVAACWNRSSSGPRAAKASWAWPA